MEHGCQVLTWQGDDKTGIWFDTEHAGESGVVIRGGIPICAPWRGRGPNNDQDPQHGDLEPTLLVVAGATHRHVLAIMIG